MPEQPRQCGCSETCLRTWELGNLGADCQRLQVVSSCNGVQSMDKDANGRLDVAEFRAAMDQVTDSCWIERSSAYALWHFICEPAACMHLDEAALLVALHT